MDLNRRPPGYEPGGHSRLSYPAAMRTDTSGFEPPVCWLGASRFSPLSYVSTLRGIRDVSSIRPRMPTRTEQFGQRTWGVVQVGCVAYTFVCWTGPTKWADADLNRDYRHPRPEGYQITPSAPKRFRVRQPGIEPGSSAWKADVLPLDHWREHISLRPTTTSICFSLHNPVLGMIHSSRTENYSC